MSPRNPLKMMERTRGSQIFEIVFPPDADGGPGVRIEASAGNFACVYVVNRDEESGLRVEIPIAVAPEPEICPDDIKVFRDDRLIATIRDSNSDSKSYKKVTCVMEENAGVDGDTVFSAVSRSEIMCGDLMERMSKAR